MTTLVAAPERSRSRPSASRSSGRTWVTIGREGQDALLDHPDRLGERVVRDVGPHDGQRSGRDGVLVDRRIDVRVLPEQDDPPAERRRSRRLSRTASRPHRRRCRRPPGRSSSRRGGELVRRQRVIRPDGLGDSSPGLGRLDDDDRRCAGGPEDGDEQAADRPGPEDDRRFTGPRVRPVGPVDDAGEGLDEGRDLGRRRRRRMG